MKTATALFAVIAGFFALCGFVALVSVVLFGLSELWDYVKGKFKR